MQPFTHLLQTAWVNSVGTNRMLINSKTPETLDWHALLCTSTHSTGSVCSTNSSASNAVPVSLVSPPQGGGWNGRWRRRSSGARLGVEWVDPKEIPLYQLQTLRSEEQDHSCSDGSDKTSISSKDLGSLTGMLFNLPGSKD